MGRQDNEMTRIKDEKAGTHISLLVMFVYLVSYMTRVNYSAVISEIVVTENIQKSLAALPSTGSAIMYGIGQLMSGFLGDRIQPKRLIITGLFTTALMNLLIPLCSSPYLRVVVWSINGLAQSFFWPPLVKLMSELLDQEMYKKSSVLISWGSSTGIILVYLLAPLCIYLSSWKLLFVVCACIALIMAVVWIKQCPSISEPSTKIHNPSDPEVKFRKSGLILLLIAVIVLEGMLREGVITWMPSYMSEIFRIDNKVTILTGVFLPLFSIFASQVTFVIYRRAVKNEVCLAGIFFASGFVSAFILALLSSSSAVLSVGFSALLTGCIHGVNLMLLGMIPSYFKKYSRVSSLIGLLNFCAYVGSAVSTYGSAALSEHFGWNTIIYIWSAIALLGSVLCIFLAKKWNRFVRNA